VPNHTPDGGVALTIDVRNGALSAGSPGDADILYHGAAELVDPPAMQEDETAIYNFSHELHNQHAVSDATFKAVVDKFGEQGVVDLIAVNGYYSLVSMILNVDRAPVPGGGKPPLPPLK